jgi:integrase
VRPLGNESINKTIGLLGTILDLAVEHGLLAANPARGRRRRLKAARPRRPFLEPDELQSLLEAARQLDTPHRPASARARFVKGLRDHGLTYIDIEERHGIPRGSAYYLYQRAIEVPEPRPEHRTTVIATLAGAGLRVGELCGLTWRDVDLTHGRLHVLDAKTPTGIREVELSPWVVEQLRGYRGAIGSPPSAAPVFVSGSGRARTEKNVCDNVVRRAVERASATRAGAGLPELPADITPHALRCTYISLLLEAGYPLPYVMAQVGHADESTTLQIYARVLKRRSRSGMHAALDGFLAGDFA